MNTPERPEGDDATRVARDNMRKEKDWGEGIGRMIGTIFIAWAFILVLVLITVTVVRAVF